MDLLFEFSRWSTDGNSHLFSEIFDCQITYFCISWLFELDHCIDSDLESLFQFER